MKEIIEILRQEMIFCGRILELSKKQTEKLVQNEAAEASTVAVEIESLLLRLGHIEENKQQLLAQTKSEDMAAFLAGQPRTKERNMALSLLQKLEKQMKELQVLSVQNHELLQRNIQYIDFTINVITQTAAGPTYASSGGLGTETSGSVKMFDKNI